MLSTSTFTRVTMVMQIITNAAGRRTAGFRGVVRVVTLAGVLLSCSVDQILDVEDIDVARPEAVQDAASLPAVLAGAIGNFGVMYNGASTDVSQVSLSGMISDEYINTETFPTRIEIDQRRQQYQSNGSLSGEFYATMQARAAADFAADGYRKFLPADAGLAEALNLSALTYVLLAENYCGAVPISFETAPGVFEYGPALTTRQLLQRAVEKTDSALVVVGGDTATSRNARVARIVKARALLNLDQPANAATAIRGTTGVPTTFQYIYTHSEVTGRQNNGTWSLVQNSGRYGVANNEGVNGLPFRSEGDTVGAGLRDPRVANVRRPTNSGNGFDGATPMWWQLKYPLRASPSIIADGVEARLIEAEAAYRAGDYPGALAILNALRSDAALATARGYTRAIAPLGPAVGAAAQENQIFKERAYWLYLTSHRLGDLRRLSRPTTAAATDVTGYGRGIETVFPTAAYHKAGTYGTDVSSPIPQAEDNNPQFVRNACNVGQP
jgi:hypothetical protein